MVSPYAGVMDPYALPRGRRNPYALPAHRGGYGSHLTLTEPVPRRKGKIDLLLPWDLEGELDPDYLCLLFHGRRGRGKSTGASGFGRFLYDANSALDPEYKVFANYKVMFADMCHPRLVDAMISFPPWLRKCLVLVDEIAVYFPSLRATSAAALNFSTFLQEIRKLGVDLIFTTQFPTMLIGNLNIQVDLFVEPHLYNKVYEPSVRRWVGNSVRLECVDWWGQWTGTPVRHRWPPEPQDVLASPSLHNLRSIYTQFNTKEVVPAFWHPSRQEVIQREWADEWAAEETAETERELELHPRAPQQPEARSLTDLLASISPEEEPVRLGEIFGKAKAIDPMLKNLGDLADAMRRLGWSCWRERGSHGPFIAERAGKPLA